MTKKANAIGIITGGGDCPGLNAAIRAAVLRCHQKGVKTYGILEGFKGLYEGKSKELHPKDVEGILSLGGTILGTSRFNPLAHAQAIPKMKAHLKKKGMTALLNIGGEGTMRLSHQLCEKGIPCVGIPKTIDNDVWGTDFTFGFNTAVQIVTDAIDRLHTTAESHNRVMLVEVMGRHTGWIATYAGIAGGADAILVPEVPFKLSRLIGIIKQRIKEGKNFSIVVVSEDAKVLLDMEDSKPEILKTPMHHDEYGNLKLGGITTLLENKLRQYLPMEVRSTILGYIQRGGTPTAEDRVLASRLGIAAADLAMHQKTGRMVALKGNEIGSIPLNQVVKKLKTVDKGLYRLGEVFFREKL